jgi:lysine N6-hydroxylase
MFALLNSQFDVMPRVEYVRYLEWAAARLKNVHYGVTVDRISFTDEGFVVYSEGKPLSVSEHLVIGMGSAPVLPAGLASLPSDRVFIADDLAERLPEMRLDLDAPVAVVGGGQTGLEAASLLLSKGFTDIKWFGRRLWFDTIDDSPAANDVYRPAHVQALQRLSPGTRSRVIQQLNPTGDALTPGAMRGVYQANYDRMAELGRFPLRLYPARDVMSGTFDGGMVELHCRSLEQEEQYQARYVVVATGRENTPVPFDDELRQRVEFTEDGELIIENDFSVRWKGMNGHSMYALNRARMVQGLTDANLTLLPVRAATVLNSMFRRQLFDLKDELCPVVW